MINDNVLLGAIKATTQAAIQERPLLQNFFNVSTLEISIIEKVDEKAYRIRVSGIECFVELSLQPALLITGLSSTAFFIENDGKIH